MTFKQSSASRPSRSLTVAIAGQSLAEYLVTSSAGRAFIERLKTVASISSVDLVNAATGGSAAAMSNDYSTGNYWFDTVLDTAGNALNAALTFINAYPSKPTVIFWDQGQSDTDAASGRNGRDPASAIADYKEATLASWAALRAACNSSSPNSVPILVMVLGRRSSYTPLNGMERVRQAQLELIATTPNVFYAGDIYDLVLRDEVHPDISSMIEYAQRAADAVATQIYSTPNLFKGPVITGVTKTSATVVTISISPDTGNIVKPSRPTALRVEDSANIGVKIPFNSSWSGNNLVLQLSSPLTGSPVLYYPYDKMIPFDQQSVIKGATSGKPLRSYYRS